MAAANSAALAEILGIPTSSSSSSSSSPYPSTVATPILVAPRSPSQDLSASEVQDRDGEQDPLLKLTTSSQSVDDYFKAKLGAMAIGRQRQTKSVVAGIVPGPATRDGAD